MRLESKAASTKTPGNSCGRSPSSWSITEVILKVIFCWQVQFAMRLSQDASHHIFAFQPEEGGRFARIRQMSVFCGAFFAATKLEVVVSLWRSQYSRNCVCPSNSYQPTNQQSNELTSRSAALDLIQGFIGMRTLSAPNFLSQKKPSSAENRISSGTALMTRRLLWPSFYFVKHV